MKTLVPILILPIAIPFRGYVLSKLWHWYVVPQFQVSELRIPFALGLSLIIGFLTYQNIDCKKGDESADVELITNVAHSILFPTLVLAFGYLYTLFI